MTKRKSYLLLNLAIILSLTISAIAAEPNSIGDILKAGGLDQLFGKWQATNDANQKIEAEFELEAGGYAISFETKVGKNEHTGMAYYSPAKKTILYTGVDNAGRVYTGQLEIQDYKLVFTLERTVPDGSTASFIRFLSMVDANTMKAVTYNIIDGKRSESPVDTLLFKRDK
jgi:hypothetical protein